MRPLLVFVLLLCAVYVAAQKRTDQYMGVPAYDQSDRIVLFRSTVHVEADGSQRVVEEITVYNGDGGHGNDEIRRGIRREFPTVYETKSGFRNIVPFRLISVQRNGRPEPFTSGEKSNGVFFLIGRSDEYLPQGLHTYRIEYETAEQVGFFDVYDELYWNATGNGWSLAIDSAVCELRFPTGARILQHACYTGLQGATQSACTSHIQGDTAIVFATTQRLQPYEGLTVAAGIPAGVIAGPSAVAGVAGFLRDNLLMVMMAGVLLVLVVVNLLFWWKKGRDPKGRTIHPQFEPPPGLSPPEVGYIVEQNFKPHLAAAALIDAAVHRYITIDVREGGVIFKHPVYIIMRHPDRAAQSTPYKSFGNETSLYAIGTIEQGKYNKALKSFGSVVQSFLETRHRIDARGKSQKGGVFARNTSLVVPGFVLLVAAFFGGFFYIIFDEITAPALLVASGGILALAAGVQVVFARLMSAYSVEGRELADSILGFRMYLEAAEKHTFDALMPPEKTLELFERYLPFAVALKVENRWAEQFKDILDRAATGTSANTSAALHSRDISSISLHSSVLAGSLSSAISSASTPPGSSSGSGGSSGGGSSGGGGGGGGGGGW